MAQPTAAEPETFPSEDDVAAIEEGLPPVPDPTELFPPSDVGLTEGEIRQQTGQAELKRLREGSAASARELAYDLEALTKAYRGGYLRVERTGPSDLPRSELGDVGKIKLKDLDANQDLAEIVHGQFGGGEFRVTPFTSRGRMSPDDPMTLEIAGDIKARSADGHAHLNRRNAASGGQGEEGVAAQAINLLREKMNEAPRADSNSPVLAQIVQAMLAQNASKDEREIARINADAAVKVAEIKAKAEKEERESKERLERERLASEERVKMAQEDAKARQAEAKSVAKYEFLTRRTEATIGLKREEMHAAGPLGVEGAKQVRGELIKASITKAMEEAGLGGAGDEEKSDAVEYLKEAGLKLVDKHGDKILGLFDRIFSRAPAPGPAGPAPQGGNRPGLPAPARGGPPAAPAAASDLDVSQAPALRSAPAPAQADGAASPPASLDGSPESGLPPDAGAPGPSGGESEIVADVQNRIVAKINGFVNALVREIASDSEPESAWDADPGEGFAEDSVEKLWRAMPSLHRGALAKGWAVFRSALPAELFGPAVSLMDRSQTTVQGREWLDKFLAAGPWNAPADDDDGDDGTED